MLCYSFAGMAYRTPIPIKMNMILPLSQVIRRICLRYVLICFFVMVYLIVRNVPLLLLYVLIQVAFISPKPTKHNKDSTKRKKRSVVVEKKRKGNKLKMSPQDKVFVCVVLVFVCVLIISTVCRCRSRSRSRGIHLLSFNFTVSFSLSLS
jgi:hypothetical protein